MNILFYNNGNGVQGNHLDPLWRNIYQNNWSGLDLLRHWNGWTVPKSAPPIWTGLILFLFGWSGNESTVTEATTGLLQQSRIMMYNECEAVDGMHGRGNRLSRRKPAPVPLCPPQIPHDLTLVRTLASEVERRRLTAWATARPLDWTYCSTRLGGLNLNLLHPYVLYSFDINLNYGLSYLLRQINRLHRYTWWKLVRISRHN
jgi:hypothetical protein